MDDNSQTADEISILLPADQPATGAMEAMDGLGERTRAAMNRICVILDLTYPLLRALAVPR
ncbi:MAG: hypothetical protein QMD99_06590 [Rhizobiaceae bacterium]|nr:hypothetical protein [Rhizobiaceae bacterium]